VRAASIRVAGRFQSRAGGFKSRAWFSGVVLMGIRILLADDHDLVRAGLRSILEQQSDFEVIAEAADGREAIAQAQRLKPDVILMDLTMPHLNGIDATRQIVSGQSSSKVIALTVHDDGALASEMLRAGASAYLLKSGTPEELIQAIRAVQRGQTYLSSRIASRVVPPAIGQANGTGNSAFALLTPKQREVLQLLAEGMSNKEVAKVLRISAKTAEAHRAQIMQKLQIHTVAGLTKYAIREGITSLDG
jgi:DNA-binding NarL/FixJ family response regulator